MFRRSPSGSRSPWRSRARSRARSSFPCRSLSPSLFLSRSRSRSGSGRESETLAHRGASTMRVDHPNSESRAAIEREFGELKRRQDKLMKAKRKITKKVHKLGDKIVRINDVLKEFERADSLPTAVFLFVHQLEKATMYFQFKTKAKQRYKFTRYASALNFASILRRDEELMSDFINIGDSDVHSAATTICWESICWEPICCESYCKQPQTLQNEPALTDWIYSRVYHVLQGDYVMDKDLEVELKKMMESDPNKYDRYFLQLPANYKKMSKHEAYKKYSELVSIINTVSKEALEEKRKSTP